MIALGQTVFWDEPLKVGIHLALQKLGMGRKFLAGIHDTDYFAKLPQHARKDAEFGTFPHNDTTTKGLWSAAGEFSSLFGAELVISRETLAKHGLKVSRMSLARPGFLDEATEAWGWRGIVALGENAPITAEVPFPKIHGTLRKTLADSLAESIEMLQGETRVAGQRQADTLLAKFDKVAETCGQGSLGEFYRCFLPEIYSFTAGREVDVETTVTTELLKFNVGTCSRSRFEIVDFFLNPETRNQAVEAYNQAVEGSGIFGLDRFGTGALPFDVVLPGHGRGTLRVGNRGIVISTPKPQFISLRKPITCVCDLAEALQKKFGEDVVLVGKAVTLITMLATEFVFVFHEGASSYVTNSKQFHLRMRGLGFTSKLNPIFRVRYSTWASLDNVNAWFKLPTVLQAAFGSEEVCAPSFASRWRQVQNDQEQHLQQIANIRRPLEWFRFLQQTVGGAWESLGRDYQELNKQLVTLTSSLDSRKKERQDMLRDMRELTQQRQELEKAKGDHFRAFLYEKEPTTADLEKRKELTERIESIQNELRVKKGNLKQSVADQHQLMRSEDIKELHKRRGTLELEAEFKRLKLIRNALISSQGLRQANRRPSGWWFPLVSSDGRWINQTLASAKAYLEVID